MSNKTIFKFYKNGSLVDLEQSQINVYKQIEAGLISQLVYRGFTCEVNIDFWRYVFKVGEKGEYFRKDSVSPRSLDYIGSLTDEDKLNSKLREVIQNLKKDILPCYRNKLLLKNLADFENKIWAFKEQQEYSKRDLYLLLLYWLHNIGNRSKYKQDSPLISATFSKQTAIKFASGRNSSNVQYIYNIFLSQTSNCQYIETKNLQGLFESLEINWFEDEHKEVIFQDSIFPHNILSISKIEENEEEIIVNPNLMKIIDNINGFGEDEIRYVTELLKSWGITTNQKNFENRLKKLGYDKFVQDNAGRRSIQDEDGIIHDIGNTKIKEQQ